MASLPQGPTETLAERDKDIDGPPSGDLTRQGVPISESDGVHPGLATTAMGMAEDEVPEEPKADPWVGRVLSNVYAVEKKIGEGGMGAVYSARHLHLQKPYAIKVLTSMIAKNRSAVERLKQEAIAASSIEHDNIVDVVNFDQTEDGAVFIVMEMLRGESLHARLEAGRMSVEEALPIAWQICAALGAAHARGIVHRDLKPENIFLALRGDSERVKVLDFGISKVKSAEAEGVRMTRTGQLVGTPLYMSPEQARGEQDIDHRVDVYALGVILYEMLTGGPPFDGRNYFELLWKHGNEPADAPRKRCPEANIPEAVEAVLLKALAKNKDERFASMEEVADALEAAAPQIVRPAIGSLTSIPPAERRASRGSMAGPNDASTPEPKRAGPTTAELVLPTTGSARGAKIAAAATLGILLLGGIAWAMQPPETVPATPSLPVVIPDRATGPSIGPAVHEPLAERPLPDGPALITVSFGGMPEGVEVRDGAGRVLCVTPCMHDLPGEVPAVLSFHRDGYSDESRTLTPAEQSVVELRLRRRRGAGSEGGNSSLHIKTEL